MMTVGPDLALAQLQNEIRHQIPSVERCDFSRWAERTWDQIRRLPEGDYLNRLSSVCGAWFASDSAWVPSC